MIDNLAWKILLVEDDEDDYLLTREMLAISPGKQIKLIWASSLEEGKQFLQGELFDAVLIDYDLGEHTGLDLIRELVARRYEAPLILITGRGGYEVDLDAMHAGATLYLTKAEINPLLLVRTIRYAIEKKQADLALEESRQELEMRVEDRTRELAQANKDLQASRFSLEERVVERTEALLKANEKLALQLTEGQRILDELRAEKKISEMEKDMLRAKEEQIASLTNLYVILSRVNEVIVRTHQPEELYARICQVVAENGFPLVWFGLLEGGEVVPVAAAGEKIGYLEEIKTALHGRLDRGPARRCIRENKTVVCENISTCAEMENWAALADRFGIHSVVATPLTCQNKPIGVFCLYAAGIATFDLERMALIEQLSEDISFALEAMEGEKQRQAAESSRRKSDEDYQALFQSMTEGFAVGEIILDSQGKPVDWQFLEINPAFEILTGQKRENVIGRRHNEILPDDDPKVVEIFGDVALHGNPAHFTHYSPVVNRHFEIFVYRQSPLHFAVLFMDISEQKASSDALELNEHHYQTLFESMQEGFYVGKAIYGADGVANDFEYLEMNAAFEKMMGRPRREMIGRRATDVVREFNPIWANVFGKVQASGEPANYSNYSAVFDRYFETYVFRPMEGQFAVLVTDITDRETSKETLELQSRLIELSYEPILSWDLETGIQTWNKGCERLYGFSRAEALGKISHQLLSTRHPQPLQEVLDQLKTQGQWSGELRHVTKDGREVIIESRQQLIQSHGRPLVLESNRDITERKRIEKALQDDQEYVRWLARFPGENPNPVLRADFNGKVLYHNPPAGRMPGWKYRTGDRLSRVMQTLLREAVKQKSETVTEIKMADRVYSISIVPFLDEGYANMYGRDITKRRIAEDALRQSETWFRTTLDSIGDAVITTDNSGHITYLNSIAEKLSGWKNAEAAGRPMEQIFPLINEQSCQPAENPVGQVLESGHIIGLANHTALVTRSGRSLPIEDSAAPIKDESGETIGVVMVFHDVSEKRKKEAALLEAQNLMQNYAQKLERSNRELQDFASIASHDLQEPLRKIKSFSDLLERNMQGRMEERDKEYIERMRFSANRMQELIQSLLMYSRVTTKAQPFRPVDLQAIVGESISGFESQIETLKADILTDGLPEIEADELQMRQLFQNLLSNSLKFHNLTSPPQISITSSLVMDEGTDDRAERLAKIEVKDNGIGFDMRQVRRIFQPFERLHGRSEYEGTGMGLAICARIVERHRGSIAASSENGHGATFTILLPVAQNAGSIETNTTKARRTPDD